MIGVRIRDGEFEGKCEYCAEFLPLTAEFWPMRQGHGLRRCRACWREYFRLKQAGYIVTRKDLHRANQRATYAAMTDEERLRRLAVNRAWKASHREHIAAYNAAYRQRRRVA